MDAQTGVRPAAPDRPPLFRRIRPADAGVVVVAVVAVVVAGTWLRVPPKVERLTVVNPTAYTVDVEVAGPDRDGWTPVMAVDKDATRTVERVLDQGRVWFFRLAAQGVSGGEVRLTREHLAGAGWRFHIPPEAGDRLGAAGAPPNP